MAQLVHSQPQMVIVPAGATPGMKDSRWLTLEVCREFQRSKCSRSDTECKFAHPPPHVEVQNGRVVACFDSIKGKCQRKEPLCKYLHPPQHLREQLLQNGRNNLILKNLQLQAYHQPHYTSVMPVTGAKTVAVPTVMPGQYSYLAHPSATQAPPQAVLRPPTMPPPAVVAHSPYDVATHYPGLQALSAVQAPSPAATYSPYLTSFAMPAGADPMTMMSQQLQPNMISAKALRAEKYETSGDNGEAVTTHSSLMESFSYPTYISQPTTSAPMQHTMVLAKKRQRDPVDEYLLQSGVPGLVPTYKRIAMSDLSKGGFPMYQTSPLMSQLQPTSLMQFQQHPSYYPMTYTYMYPPDATLIAPEMSSPFPRNHLTATVATTIVPPRPSSTTTTATSSVISDVTSAGSIDDSILTSPSGLSLYMFSQSNHSSAPASAQSVTSTPSLTNNAYYVEYFGNNKQLRDTLPVCLGFSSGTCSDLYCKLVHLSEDYVEVNNNQVTVCRDFATRKSCRRSRCKYYHIPVELPPS